jgi:hypothetical protein
LLSNEQKPDWIHEDLGRKIGPRPELVAEMMSKGGMPLHLMSVQSFLVYARKYLGVTVSESTVQQAKHASHQTGLVQDMIAAGGPVRAFIRDEKAIEMRFANGDRLGFSVDSIPDETYVEILDLVRSHSPGVPNDPWATLPPDWRTRPAAVEVGEYWKL